MFPQAVTIEFLAHYNNACVSVKLLCSYYNTDIVISHCTQTTTEFESALTDKQAYNPGSLSSVAYLAYDAVWTLALAIERYIILHGATVRTANVRTLHTCSIINLLSGTCLCRLINPF